MAVIKERFKILFIEHFRYITNGVKDRELSETLPAPTCAQTPY